MEDIKTHIPGLFQVSLSLFIIISFHCVSMYVGKKEGKQARKREREKINFKTVYNKKKPGYFEAKLYATTANLIAKASLHFL